MHEGKNKNLNFFIEDSKLLTDAAVSVSFKAKVNCCVLNNLKGATCCCLKQGDTDKRAWPSGSEEAVICFAMYLLVRDALCGNPLATVKSKVASVNCGANDNCFFITWKVKSKISSIRKSLGMALKVLNPSKIFTDYSRCVREIGGRPVREHFNYVANEIALSLKDSIDCGVVGRIDLRKIENSHIDDLLKVLVNKIRVSDVTGNKQKPSGHSECSHEEYTELKVDGWEADVVRDYINAKLRGVPVVICSKTVMVGLPQSKWNTAAAKLKRLIKDYVQLKHAKVGNDLAIVMGYAMIANADVCCSDVKSLIKNKITASEVEKAINKAF